MSIYVFWMDWRGERLYDLFCRTYEKRWNRKARRFLLAPRSELHAHLQYLSAEEVGQVLGGN